MAYLLIVDSEASCTAELLRWARSRGIRAAVESRIDALSISQTDRPTAALIVAALSRIAELHRTLRIVRMAVAGVPVYCGTHQDAIVVTNVAWRAGFDGCLRVPLTDIGSAMLLGKPEVASPTAVRREVEGATQYSLARVRWEYLARVVQESGSLRKAAFRLGLDRRSLRRMLSKNPPPR